LIGAEEYQELFPPVEDFLRNYLQQWDGKSNVREIFELASFLPLREYKRTKEETP
jgi:hypothetical protein